MAITDLDVFAHLTDADIENLGIELDAMLTLLGQADLGVTAELRILLRAAYWPQNYVFGARTTCRPSGQRDFQHVC